MGFFDRKKDDDVLVDEQAISVIPIVAESLTVHKTLADSGGVRIQKKILEELINVDEPLLKQSVQVVRTAIGREVDAPLPIRYEGNSTIIPVIEERLVTRRQLYLVEEIRLTRVEQTERSPQAVTLRREEIVIERQDMESGTWRAEPSAPAAGPAPSIAAASSGPTSRAAPGPSR